jgi:putative membrane-bound dehydrogenase-like protein
MRATVNAFRSVIVVACILAGSATLASATQRPTDAPRLKVLFLGDHGHHRPEDRASQLMPVFALRGIDVTYTGRPGDLNLENLRRYDALLIYANIERIEPTQEQALLDYVAEGGAFIPVHCASFCFLNSPRYVELVGAQFLRHGTGEIEATSVDPDHPIMKGFESFRTWDETYVHHKHNAANRHVLQTRPEGSHVEPWTWTRTHGKGRVVYTAYGHDARTWQQPGFHDLIERGIRWASRKGEVYDSRPRVAAGLPPVESAETGAGIPNYLPGQKWGLQGEPHRKMPRPLAPAESARHLALPGGLRARLFVAEPDIVKPLCMAWDHLGRLWIVESVDYPNSKRDSGPGRDRIRICEDRDGDGRAETFTVFAEGLNIPTSLCFAHGGVIVHQAPDTLFLRDTDGDDRADEWRVLFTGWGTRDTHAGPSNLRWGLDNWIWGIVGYSAFRGTVGGESHAFAQGIYRFRPDGSKLEFLRSTNNNSWGLGFSEEGLVFASTANGCPSVFMAIPNRYYESVRGRSPGVLEKISATNEFFPATNKVRQVDWHGGFTAATGHALYTARAYPKAFWNQAAFVSEPTGHLVAAFTLQPRGADFQAFYGWNLLASDDEWSAPIAAEVGPDGNVWVIDWYNYIVQHNPTPQGFRTGKGNAYETPIRDRTHGRIYRIVHDNSDTSRRLALDPAHPSRLVAVLASDNQFWRLHAQRLLVERGRVDVVPDLVRLVDDPVTDGIGLNPGAIHALWTLHGLGALGSPNSEASRAAVRALKHPSAGVRRNALMVLPRDEGTASRIIESGALGDENPQVRLAAFLAISEVSSSESAARALAAALLKGAAGDDRWLIDAATAAAAAHGGPFLQNLATARTDQPSAASVLIVAGRSAEHVARGVSDDTLGRLLRALAGNTSEFGRRVTGAVLAGLGRGWPKDRPARLDQAAEEAIRKLVNDLPTSARGRLARLAGLWGVKGVEESITRTASGLEAILEDEARPEAARIDAARELVELRPSDARLANRLVALITPRTSPALAAGLIDAIAQGSSPSVGELLCEAFPAMTPATRPSAIRALLGRVEWSPALLAAMESGKVRVSDLTLDQRQALSAHPNRAIAERARRLLVRNGGLPDRDRQLVIDRLAPLVRDGGDPGRGRRVFTEQCAKCHRHGTEGGKVGPDLTGMSSQPRQELLVHILDPSRSVEGNYVQYTVATREGRVLSGLLSGESRTTVELVDADGKSQVLIREDIEDLTASKKSIMPEGFEKQIPPAELADLLAFLTGPSAIQPALGR